MYADFLMPPRLSYYEALLQRFIDDGYVPSTIGRFWAESSCGAHRPAGRRLLMRHDIDTDVTTARCLFDVERSLGVSGTWFFRLGTFDTALIADIAAAGGEIGYHFEELSTHAKRHRLHSPPEVRDAMPAIRRAFQADLAKLRERTSLPMSVAAAHGDFANRMLGVTNCEVLADAELRTACGIELEAYDEAFGRLIDARVSDCGHPAYWRPRTPEQCVDDGATVLQILVHPRHWCANPRVNLADNVRRCAQGIWYGR